MTKLAICMDLKIILTKRWFIFFRLLFVVWYIVTFCLVTVYGIFPHPLFLLAGNMFTPLWIFLISYLYFRRTHNDWPARFVTAIGWMVLVFVFAALLSEPVYGASWTGIFTWNVIDANWINAVAILMGGVASHRSVSTNVSVEDHTP